METFDKIAGTVLGMAFIGAVGANLYMSATDKTPPAKDRQMRCVKGGDTSASIVYSDNGEMFAETHTAPVEKNSIVPWSRAYSYADARYSDGMIASKAFNLYGPSKKFPLGQLFTWGRRRRSSCV